MAFTIETLALIRDRITTIEKDALVNMASNTVGAVASYSTGDHPLVGSSSKETSACFE